ncbi:hypothetical protein F5144DRAFT_594427 [Chaetomium tenue]|uniref:Uncharacterized protein n=1 Tax=Chaetomium tenue TaxID=1854479 RepID=A0ACB7P3G7_9PEZI|nr:hypothetical protein F5144DRAFT_594427 [Chaetomium globosum]
MTLVVPFIAFLSIKLSNRIRFALLGVFALGALVTITSLIRLYYVLRMWYIEPKDRHYSLGYTLNTVEVNLAIVTATIPALWPLGRLWFPAMFESMGINRPYLYPDIEVGYVLSQSRASRQVVNNAGAGATTKQARPALRGKILWLQRPRQPSFLRPPPSGGDAGIGLTDIREQRVFGVTTRRRNHADVGGGNDEDGFEDYHEMIRRTEVSLVHEGDGASTLCNPTESEGARSNSDMRGG